MRLVVHNDAPQLRGNERQLLHLAGGLSARGHGVLVSCRSGGALTPALKAVGIATTGVRPRGDVALPSALAFRGLLARERPDALLLTSWKRLFWATWAGRGAGVPRVVARLGIVRRPPSGVFASWKLRGALARVDTLVVNSEEVARVWRAGAPWFPPDRVQVIPNAVAVAAPGDPRLLRTELGVPASIHLVLTVAALEHRKNTALLLRALPELPAEVHVVVAGDGPEAESLRALASSLGVAPRVHWLGSRADVPDLLAGADAFALPSRQDSVPNALIEAMAAGLPVVATEGIGADELGVERIVPQEDPAALARAITGALAAPRAEAESAAALVRARFGVERMVAEYERVLFGLAGGPP